MKKKASSSNNNHHNDEIVDERFLAATNRPQFRSSSSGRKGRKSKLSSTKKDGSSKLSGNLHSRHHNGNDSDNDNDDDDGGLGESLAQAIRSDDRFSAALTNSEKFGVVPGMDKYGRKLKKKKKKKKQSNNDSRESADDGDEQQDSESEEEQEMMQTTKLDGQDSDGSDDDAKKQQPMDMESRIAYLNALSRGEISASSSSEDDSDDDDDDSKSDDDDDNSSSTSSTEMKVGIFDPTYNQLPGDLTDNNLDDETDAQELTTDPTPYLVILNLDWTHTRAVDVYAMLHSFCPPGTLRKVDIYPSDFGKRMMEKEVLEGPTGLWKKNKKSDKDDDEEEDGDKFWSDDDDEEDEGESSAGKSDSQEEDDDDANTGEDDDDEDDSDDEEDILNMEEATAKLYSHFPPQSAVMKNSQLQTEDEEEEGFDHEKLRAYEASKLRYYFAIATFTSPEATNPVYENVDGMEMEHSAAEIDVRALPVEQYDETIEGRELHDTCDHLPGKYAPPDNVVTALRQSKVTCSWERGDSRREKALTRYGMGKEAWEAMATGDDIKFYLASDNSSAGEESDDDNDDDECAKKETTKGKGKKMRALLGLGGSDDDEMDEDDAGSNDDGRDSDSGSDSDAAKDAAESSESEDDDEAEESMTKQVTFTPGKKNLEEKIRSKLNPGETEELTPFQKYLEKRKQKRRERRQASRKQKKGGNTSDDSGEEELLGDNNNDDDGMHGVDPEFGVAKFSDEESIDGDNVGQVDDDGDGSDDGFFLEGPKSGNKKKRGKNSEGRDEGGSKPIKENKMASTKEELELLIAGDDDEEEARDFDMRGLEKLERHANKKLRGKRKRQLQNLAANVSGQGFQVDTKDDRFSAMLEGTDDRFGIDRTNPAFKETTAMKTLLEEQAKRRKKNRGKNKEMAASDKRNNQQIGKKQSDGPTHESGGGAMELSSLVMSLQKKVKNTDKLKKKKMMQ